MKLEVLAEPLLQFGTGQHVDVRAGLLAHGTFDRGASNVPKPIGVGLVGTTVTVDGVRDWLEQCRMGVASGEEKLRELRPDFPGVQDTLFGTRLALSDTNTRTVSRHELMGALAAADSLNRVVDVFLDHARDLAGRGGLHVLIVAPPAQVFALGDAPAASRDRPVDATEEEPDLDESQEAPSYGLNFHDIFKARALELAVPCQVIRPDTYGGERTRRPGQRLQDPATRAWNFHTALYYKAGGVPWRLVRQPGELDTCYVGTSFFFAPEGDRLLTSVAQVFNERGEGLILQGGNARIDRRDRTPHLSTDDARRLLSDGLAAYRREHKNMPARVLVHKTSYFDGEELDGCRAAAQAERVELLDLVSVRRSGIRLLRANVAPVLRGTTLLLDDRSGVIYLKGMVPFFKTYPGQYIPRGLEFTRADGESPPHLLARELLELSKLNFNNTQFDSGDPITVRAARRVGDILKHVSAGRKVQSRFRYFT